MNNPPSISARRGPVAAPLSVFQRVARLFTIAAPLLLVAATMVRFTVRDANDASAPLFYAAPWPVIAVGWLVWLAAVRFRARWLVPGVIGILLATGAFFLEVKGTAPVPPVPVVKTVKVLFWNMAHAKDFPEELHRLLEAKKPDLVALSEFPKPSDESLAAFAKRQPALRAKALPGDMLIAARGDTTVEKVMSLPRRSRLNVCRVTFDGDSKPWTVGVADIGPWPITPRDFIIREISDNVWGGPRTLALGDFNTPFESVSFDSWRDRAWHGLANAPNTPRLETWFFGVPLLSIDHIWMSKDVFPQAGETGVSLPMDHSWVLCTVGIPD